MQTKRLPGLALSTRIGIGIDDSRYGFVAAKKNGLKHFGAVVINDKISYGKLMIF